MNQRPERFATLQAILGGIIGSLAAIVLACVFHLTEP